MTTTLKRLRALPMRSLQTRILALFLLLIFVVQVGGFVLINTVGGKAARSTVGAEVAAGARVFDRLLEQDAQRLVQGARLMAADYAFREVIATGDHDTIGSVLVNYGKRIEAPLVMIVGLDQKVLGDTLGQRHRQAVRAAASARSGGSARSRRPRWSSCAASSTSWSSCRCWLRCRSRGRWSGSASTMR